MQDHQEKWLSFWTPPPLESAYTLKTLNVFHRTPFKAGEVIEYRPFFFLTSLAHILGVASWSPSFWVASQIHLRGSSLNMGPQVLFTTSVNIQLDVESRNLYAWETLPSKPAPFSSSDAQTPTHTLHLKTAFGARNPNLTEIPLYLLQKCLSWPSSIHSVWNFL